MKRRVSIFISLWLFILIGHGIGNTSSESSVPIMKADEIKIGMTGYGKTVFQGTKIDKFDVEILGVLKNGRGPKYDMILIRCHHPVIDKAGIIAGMSGSPIYIVTDKAKEPEGKLIGVTALLASLDSVTAYVAILFVFTSFGFSDIIQIPFFVSRLI